MNVTLLVVMMSRIRCHSEYHASEGTAAWGVSGSMGPGAWNIQEERTVQLNTGAWGSEERAVCTGAGHA